MNLYLERKGIRIGTGTIVDAIIIHAPSSTKNSWGERDPEMHQTRKGKQWYFGAKAHIGVDAKEGHVHSVCTSAASVSDVHMLPDLLHGEEKKVWGDGGYQGQTDVIHSVAPEAQDMTCRRTHIRTAWMKKSGARTGISQGAGQGGMALPYLEARVWIYQGSLPGIEEESPMAVGCLRPGEPIPASQTAGPTGGVVSLESEKDALRAEKRTTTRQSSSKYRCKTRAHVPLLFTEK